MRRTTLNADQYYRNITFLDKCVHEGRINILFGLAATAELYVEVISNDAEDLLVLVLLLR
jgi:hypothetical protein